MNQFAILLIIFGLVISGCGEAVDSTYRESSETRHVPTLHLVADNIQTKEGFDISSGGRIPIRSVTLSCHVQSDRPLEYDTLVLVDMERGIDVERTTEERKFLVILAVKHNRR